MEGGMDGLLCSVAFLSLALQPRKVILLKLCFFFVNIGSHLEITITAKPFLIAKHLQLIRVKGQLLIFMGFFALPVLSALSMLLCVSLTHYEAPLATSESGCCLSGSCYRSFFLSTF